MPTMTVADIYGRKSSDDRGKSVNDQLVEGQAAVEENGWTLGRVFTDDNRSASRFARKEREDFAELLDHIRGGQCELLVLWESSRGSRRLAEWAEFLELCRERAVRLHVVSHQRTYDVRIARDWKQLATDGVDAHAESNVTSERSLRGKRRSAAAGRPAGKLQFGFRRVYDDAGVFVEQVEHPDQAPLVREAAQRVLAGEACNSIAVDFNARGIPGPRGGRWDLTQVKRLCTMPAYAGLRQHQGQVVGKAAWKGIHDEDTYSRLLARLSDPKRRTQRDSSLKHVLSGLIRCALCESVMRVLSNRGYLCYTCRGCLRTSVRTTSVEAFIIEMVLVRLERGDAVSVFSRPERAEDTAKAQAEVAAFEGRLAPFYAAASAGKISATGLAAIEADLLPQIEAAKARAVSAQVVVPEPIRKLVEAPRKRWPDLTVSQQREAIGLLVAELKVGSVGRGKRVFDFHRLGESRWVNDRLRWRDHWS